MIFKKKYQNFSDEQLMEFIQQGNIAAFNEIYCRYSQRLLHYFYRALGENEDKAQDFLQDLFLKLVEKPFLFTTSKKFSTWIFTVAHNMCKNEYRRLDVRKIVNNETDLDSIPHNVEIDYHSMERMFDQKMFQHAVFSELDKFDSCKKAVFLLRYQQDLSIKEISDIMACPEGTVKSRLFYVTRKLANKLKSYHSLES